MNKDEIINSLKEIVLLYTEDKAAVETMHEDTDFLKDLKVNSANLVDIVLDIEEKFNIEIDNDSMAKMLTVKNTIEIIEQKLAENAGK
ncbi:phosphopantetheine-binding protein [Pedobacter mucosus]|uniref:phosphopantetheine-binding protein n=1 Tax=Pedobacter mucosus TaxID=2895286 RepID=UPI001EE40C80|nr:phosphopantetheine-binding protein [Pedobacter mucosus]UKT62831.1 phosphopantetheine-binding protein [Pedobacter mucosus]